jgi:hypothetical protein
LYARLTPYSITSAQSMASDICAGRQTVRLSK